MTSSRFFKTVLIALVLSVAAAIAGLPWSLYRLGLSGLSGKPVKALHPASSNQQLQLWRQAGYAGAPAMEVLNPVSYILSASTQEAPPPSTAFAWRIASAYQRQHHLHDGMMWNQLTGAALAIWLTRHWSIEDMLSKVIEMQEARSATQH